MCDKRTEADDIDLAWRIRGESDKVYHARNMGFFGFVGLMIVFWFVSKLIELFK